MSTMQATPSKPPLPVVPVVGGGTSSDFRLSFVRECKRLGLPSMEHNSQFLKNIRNNEIRVRGERVHGREWEGFAHAITADNSIRSIDLYCDHLSQAQQVHGRGGGKGRTPAIQEVGVSSRVSRGISECLVSSSVLRKLQFSNIFFTPDALKFIASGLPHNHSLQMLGYIGCKIGDDGLAALYPGIQSNTTITHLVFVGCNLTDKSAVRVARLIQHHAVRRHTTNWMATLRDGGGGKETTENKNENENNNRSTNESGNEEEREKVAAQQRLMQEGLTHISLESNMIGDKGATALADALKADLWIQEMNLKSNAIGLEGAKALKDALLENETLATLILQDNRISDMHVLSEIKSEVAMNIDQKNQILQGNHNREGSHPRSSLSLSSPSPSRVVPQHTIPLYQQSTSSRSSRSSGGSRSNGNGGSSGSGSRSNDSRGSSKGRVNQFTTPINTPSQPSQSTSNHSHHTSFQDTTMKAIASLKTSLVREQAIREHLEAQIHDLMLQNHALTLRENISSSTTSYDYSFYSPPETVNTSMIISPHLQLSSDHHSPLTSHRPSKSPTSSRRTFTTPPPPSLFGQSTLKFGNANKYGDSEEEVDLISTIKGCGRPADEDVLNMLESSFSQFSHILSEIESSHP